MGERRGRRRGRSEAVIETLELAQARGLPTVNTSGGVRNVVDKAVMHERLSRAAVPMPESWIGGWPALAFELADVTPPVVVKPVKGDNCRDVHVVPNGAALAKLAFPYDDAIVQRYLPNAGFDDAAISEKARGEWGSCAGVALARAAGGVVTYLDGKAPRFNRIPGERPLGSIAAGPTLRPRLLEAFIAAR